MKIEREFYAPQKNICPKVAVFPSVCYNRAMVKLLTDVHTHTKFSPDGIDGIEEMLKAAHERGACYYGVSEHFDYDYKVDGVRFAGGAKPVYTDPELYFSRARALQKSYAGRMEVLVGGEFGFTANPAAAPLYRQLLERYRPDFVVNSVHSNGRADYAEAKAFYADGALRPKKEVYREYFSLVEKSVDAPYEYDIIGHLTYCTRYAPYADKRARREDFADELDGILTKVIAADKILEVNSSSYGCANEFLPDRDILERYFALGGRNVSFASDAHGVSRILDKREIVVSVLREIGFGFITVPRQGKHIRVEI